MWQVHVLYDRFMCYVIGPCVMWQVHVLLYDRFMCYVTGSRIMWQDHVLCDMFMYYVTDSCIMWLIHVLCDRFVYYVTGSCIMWQVYVLCDKVHLALQDTCSMWRCTEYVKRFMCHATRCMLYVILYSWCDNVHVLCVRVHVLCVRVQFEDKTKRRTFHKASWQFNRVYLWDYRTANGWCSTQVVWKRWRRNRLQCWKVTFT